MKRILTLAATLLVAIPAHAENFFGDGTFRFNSSGNSVKICVSGDCITARAPTRAIPKACTPKALRTLFTRLNDDVNDYRGESITTFATVQKFLLAQPNRDIYMFTYDCARGFAGLCVGPYNTTEIHEKNLDYDRISVVKACAPVQIQP
jgi:hypothetical protein